MQEKVFEITANQEIARDVWEIRLTGDTSGMEKPGQFVNISLPGFFLRRPISVCCVEGQELTLIYKTVGKGTACLSTLRTGKLDVLTGLGNGYNLEPLDSTVSVMSFMKNSSGPWAAMSR